MSHWSTDMINDRIIDEVANMDRADKVNFCRDYYGLDTVNNMNEVEMEEKIGEIMFDNWQEPS